MIYHFSFSASSSSRLQVIYGYDGDDSEQSGDRSNNDDNGCACIVVGQLLESNKEIQK